MEKNQTNLQKKRELCLITIDERNKIEYYEGSWRTMHWSKDVELDKMTIWNCKIGYYIKLSDALVHFLNSHILSDSKNLLDIISKIEEFKLLIVEISKTFDERVRLLESINE